MEPLLPSARKRDWRCHPGSRSRATRRFGLALVGINTEAAWNPKEGIPVSFTTYLAPDPSEVSRARRFIREGCEATYLRPEAVEGIVLAVSEACANAVEYSGASKVRVTWDRVPEGVVVEIVDDGRFEQEPTGDHLRLGLAIAARVVDEITIKPGSREDPGTVVRLVQKTGRISAGTGGSHVPSSPHPLGNQLSRPA